MLHSMAKLRGAKIHATDGDIGSVRDVYFDDATWQIRYFVVDTGSWLPGRLVLLAPEATTHLDLDEGKLLVNLTKQQVEASPDLQAHEPVSRQHEMAVRTFYGWPFYWPVGADEARAARDLMTEVEPELRSGDETVGYYLHAQDGNMGHVDDFLVEEPSWAIRYLVVDTRNWWPGKKVLIAPEWVREFLWGQSTLEVDLARDQIEHSPEYDPESLPDRRYESLLYEHYERRPYWH